MGRKAVPSGALWACDECGVVFVDHNKSIKTRDKPPENEKIFYLSGHCPNCDRSRVEVIDIISAEASERVNPRSSLNYKESPVVDSSDDN